jgi:hypothetical protein
MDPRYACPDLVFILETCAVALCDEFVMNTEEILMYLIVKAKQCRISR